MVEYLPRTHKALGLILMGGQDRDRDRQRQRKTQRDREIEKRREKEGEKCWGYRYMRHYTEQKELFEHSVLFTPQVCRFEFSNNHTTLKKVITKNMA